MFFQTRSPGIVFSLVGIVAGAVALLGAYAFYLHSQLNTARSNLEDARAQVVLLEQDRQRTQIALDRLVRETTTIRQEMLSAKEEARMDEEYREWAPNRLPQIVIDTLRRP